MYENELKNQIPINVNFMKSKNNRNIIRKQKMMYSFYNNEKNRNISLTKNKQNNYIQKFSQNQDKSHLFKLEDSIIRDNNRRLTQNFNENNNIINSSLFEKSYNNINNKYYEKKINNNNYNENTIKKMNKHGKFLSSENLSFDLTNPPMTVLINNGVIKNMFLNKKKINDLSSKKQTQNINKINNNSNSFIFPKPQIYKSINERKGIYELKNKNDFNNNNNYLNEPYINKYNFKEIHQEYFNKIKLKKSFDKYVLYKNIEDTNILKNNIHKSSNNNTLNQNFFNNSNKSFNINISKNKRKNNNNLYQRKHFYNQTDIYKMNIEDNSFLPLPIKYKTKYSYEIKQKPIQTNKNRKNSMNKNQSYIKIPKRKSISNIYSNNINNINYNNNNKSLISSSSSDELSLIADQIVNNINKNKNKTDSYKIKQKNKKPKINKSASLIEKKSIKIKKLNSLMTPININSFFINSKNKNEDNNKNNNISIEHKKDCTNTNINFYANNQNKIKEKEEEKEKEKEKIKKNEDNGNSIFVSEFCLEKNISEKKNSLKDENKLNNINNKNEDQQDKNNESIEENFDLIEQIMNQAEKEEKNKRNRHIDFNLENNTYIHYNPKDLITKKVIFKEDKKMEINEDNDKKMDIYYALLKSKTKFNPIIKKFNKEDIKINKAYELNEELEEYEILGDLYNIFFSKEINDLDIKLKNSIDKFMIDKTKK